MRETPESPFLLLADTLGEVLGFVSLCILLGVLLFVSYTDLRNRVIPNEALLVSAGSWFVVLAASALQLPLLQWLLLCLECLVGALFLGGFSLVTALALEYFSGKSALGGGDVKLLFVMGLYLGLSLGLLVLFAACLLLLLFALLRALLRKGPDEGLPFAPFLTCGVLLSALSGLLAGGL